VTPLRDRLPALDPARAERQTRLIAALNARRLGEQTLSVRVAPERDRRAASAWIRFRTGTEVVAIAPLLVDGELVRLSGAGGAPDTAIAARLLGAIEPLTVALESALSADLHPEGLASAPPDGAILLRLDASCARHAIRHRLIVAVPATGAVARSVLPATDSALLSALRARWTATIEGPPIPARHLGTIVAGDLYLLGVAPLVARITLPGHRGVVRARVEPSKGSLTLQDDIVPAPADLVAATPSAPPGEPDGVDWSLVKLPATVEIAGGLLSGRDITGFAAGSVLPLPGSGGTLEVRVVAGGAVIGAGELVAIGDGFGVLFTSAGADSADDREG
jgi:type III secretion protein Q